MSRAHTTRVVLLLLMCRPFVGGFVTLVRTWDNNAHPEVRQTAKRCKEFQVGVSICNEVDIDGKDLEILVHTTYFPSPCPIRVAKGGYVRMHYNVTIDESSKVGVAGKLVDESNDFTRGTTFRIGLDSALVSAWDYALVGMCVGQRMNLVVPYEVGYKEVPPQVPKNTTLHFEMEIMIIMDADKRTGEQLPPNLFSIMDLDKSGDLDEDEVRKHFTRIRQGPPTAAVFADQDLNKNGKISWEEFTGPKGIVPERSMQIPAGKGKKDEL